MATLDMERAYYGMDWDFLLAFMEGIGFDDTWLKWIDLGFCAKS